MTLEVLWYLSSVVPCGTPLNRFDIVGSSSSSSSVIFYIWSWVPYLTLFEFEVNSGKIFSATIYTRSDLKTRQSRHFKKETNKWQFYSRLRRMYRPCTKRVFTECSNMAYLVTCNRTQNPHHNQEKWSFCIAQRKILNKKSVFQNNSGGIPNFGLFWNETWKRRWQRIHVQTRPCAQDCDLKWTFSCKKTFYFMAHGAYFSWPIQRFKYEIK